MAKKKLKYKVACSSCGLQELDWPERIYLQHGNYETPPFKECGEVTWASEDIHGNDVGYVRVDALEAAEQRASEMQRRWKIAEKFMHQRITKKEEREYQKELNP